MKQKKMKYGKDFTLVVAGQIVSLFGNAILRFALPLYLLRETGSSALFGIVTACSLLPMIVLSLLGGVLADRVNKRNIMVGLDFLTAVILMGFYFIMGIAPIVPLFIVTLMLLYGISGTYQPAVQASIPVLVPKDRILSASAIVNQIGSLAGFIGPIIGGMLYGIWGIEGILKVSIVCFLLSAIMELFIVIPAHRETGKNKILQLAVGGILGGLLTVAFEKKLHPCKASVFLYLCAGFTCVMGFGMLPQGMSMFKYIVLTGTGMAVTIASTMFSIQMLAVVQTQTPAYLVGKVIACIMAIIMCAQPIGQLMYGVLFEVCGQHISGIIIGAGVISFLITIYAGNILPQLGDNGHES